MDCGWVFEAAAGIQHHRSTGGFRFVLLLWDHTVVQFLLNSVFGRNCWRQVLVWALALAVVPAAVAKKDKQEPVSMPELLLEGGRKLSFERSFWSEREV